MNVFENVAFRQRLRKVEKKEIERRVKEVLKMVQLEGFDRRSIRKLSGGYKWAAIAFERSLMNLEWSSRWTTISSWFEIADGHAVWTCELQQRLGITLSLLPRPGKRFLAMRVDWSCREWRRNLSSLVHWLLISMMTRLTILRDFHWESNILP